MAKYAHGTTTQPANSRAELERVLERYGATGFYYAVEEKRFMIGFRSHSRVVRIVVPTARQPRSTQQQWEAETRRLWRCVVLQVKSKLEVVASGIATFEQEFLANLVLPDNSTVGDQVAPHLDHMYRTGQTVPLLPGVP